ncbi:hypothetical protein COZ55_00250 [archaeon CG_4_8_14_3_um_filter_38_5]|nr:MAG: hypothetical protein COS83_03955 [archaeon CG07_land_8_20_14_0_80_38_8]PIU88073.1 MAG: hypothetical protein COS64_04850 [archaeon CG06_land_8_20_14_3_00_37_11]PIX44582.1 MAG: hypothetical protein COZ55_00250 [archaeon CG_4_8_14_3_um_filter_38_5]
MAEVGIIQGIINAFNSDFTTSIIILIIGFLICHLLHALRYGFSGYGGVFEKIKKFFKVLFFLNI